MKDDTHEQTLALWLSCSAGVPAIASCAGRNPEIMMNRIAIFVALWLMACAGASAQSAQGPASAPGKAWSVGTRPAIALTEGQVEGVDRERGEVVIQHGDLPNLGMEPMTMGFAVADQRMLDRLKPGDKVRFNAEIKNGEATVTYIEPAR